MNILVLGRRPAGISAPHARHLLAIHLLILIFLTVLSTTGRPEAGQAQTGVRDATGKLHGERPGTGYVPPQVDLSHLRPRGLDGLLTFPRHFDWRESGKVSPVKNQGYCGSCYAFAAIANVESRLLVQGDSLFDFSENNVKECEWFEASCGGGNDWMAANLLTSAGTVIEACDPYVPGDVECKSSCRYRKTLMDWRVASGEIPASVDALKNCIMTYGPVYSTLYVGNADAWRTEFTAYDGSYVLSYDGEEAPNHAILIVGWDDDFAHAGGTGAWIVKNSWGTSWGGTCGFGSERGYFMIAYGSARIGANSSFAARVEDYSPADTLLYYDEGGFGGCIGIMNRQTAWGLCRFQPSRSIQVKQVEFWTADAMPDVDIYVYDDFDGAVPSNLLASRLDNVFDFAGYHSVPLAWPLTVEAGEDIYVAVKFTSAASRFPLVYDGNGPRKPGHCFMSSDGAVFSEFTFGDLGIRLRAAKGTACAAAGEAPVITNISDVAGDGGGYVLLTWARNSGDRVESGDTKQYRIWRKCRESSTPMLQSSAYTDERDAAPFQHGSDGPAWEHIGTVRATGSCHYEITAPTHCDRSLADSCWTYFRVTAHTGVLGEHYDSPVERGYSIDNTGISTGPGGEPLTSPEEEGLAAARARFGAPVPNPSRDGFAFEFSLPGPDRVEVSVYDIRGRKMEVILDEVVGAGPHVVTWDLRARDTAAVPPGIFFLRLATSSETHTARLVVMR